MILDNLFLGPSINRVNPQQRLFRIATVTEINPLRARLDGGTVSIPVMNTSGGSLAGIGDRVVLLKYGRQFLCLGVVDGVLPDTFPPEMHGNEAHAESYLSSDGGVITGDLSVESDIIANREIILPYWDKDGYSAAIRVIRTSGRRYLMIDSGHQGGNTEGAKIYIYNNEDSGNPGQIRIYPGSGSSLKFVMYDDGSVRIYGDAQVDGIVKIPHAVGGPATFQVSGASDRQIAYLMADGTTNTDIRLYGPQDDISPSRIVLRTAGSNALTIYSDQRARFYGDVSVDGAFTNPSSKKLKTNIKPASITDCYEHIKGLKFKTYNLKSEIEKLPEEASNFLGLMVEESPEIIKGKDGESINVINYISLIGAAVQAVQKKVEDIENRTIELETRLTRIIEEARTDDPK